MQRGAAGSPTVVCRVNRTVNQTAAQLLSKCCRSAEKGRGTFADGKRHSFFVRAWGDKAPPRVWSVEMSCLSWVGFAPHQSRSGTHAPQEDQIPGIQGPSRFPATAGRHRRRTSPATPQFNSVSTPAPVSTSESLSVGARNRGAGHLTTHSSLLFSTNKPPKTESAVKPALLLRI